METTRFDRSKYIKAKDLLSELLLLKSELGSAFDYTDIEVYAEEVGERVIDHVTAKSGDYGRTIVIEC